MALSRPTEPLKLTTGRPDPSGNISQGGMAQPPVDPFKDRMSNYFNPEGDKNLTLSGTKQEQQSQLSAMELARLGYGQNLAQTGEDISRIRGQLRERSTQGGMDPVSAAIRGQKSGALSRMGSDLASSGIKGAAAQAMLGAEQRKQDAQIAESLYGQQRQSLMDEKNLASNTLSGTVGLMQGGKAEGTVAGIPAPPKPQGFFESLFGGLF